jgi:hypothetical protein
MYSEAVACMCHNMCTAVSSDQISSSQSINVRICFALLHAYFFLCLATIPPAPHLLYVGGLKIECESQLRIWICDTEVPCLQITV